MVILAGSLGFLLTLFQFQEDGIVSLWPINEDQAEKCRQLEAKAWIAGRDLHESTIVRSEAQIWVNHVEDCPQSPYVLIEAAKREVLSWMPIPAGVESRQDTDKFSRKFKRSRSKALAWLSAAAIELNRSQKMVTVPLHFWRARSLLALGEYPSAKVELLHAQKFEDVPRWRIDRCMALVHLFEGQLDLALELGYRSLNHAVQSDRSLSKYVLGMIVERMGDPDGARQIMNEVMEQDRGRVVFRIFQTLLPVHERIWLLAYAYSLASTEPSVAVRMWKAYLARPANEVMDRQRAELYLKNLAQLPTSSTNN